MDHRAADGAPNRVSPAVHGFFTSKCRINALFAVSGCSHRRGAQRRDCRLLSRFLSRQRARPLLPRVARFFLGRRRCCNQSHGPRPRSRPHRRGRRPAARDRFRPDRRLHAGRGRGRHRRLLAGAALRRRAHAHRRRRAGTGACGSPAGEAAAGRQLHVRDEARRDPLRADQRDHAAPARRSDRLRGRSPPDRAPGRRGRAGPDRRYRRHRREPGGRPAACRRGAAQPQRGGRLPARAHRSVRVHRHRDCGRADPDLGFRARRRDRLAADRRA